MGVKVFVDGGGGRNQTLSSKRRRGFTEFFRKAGLDGRMPRIVDCGARDRAYRDFTIATAKDTGYYPLLLVDSEGPVVEQDAWMHMRSRAGDQWERPSGALQDQLHLMVQAMEAWFCADRRTLEDYFGAGFRAGALSRRPDVEEIPKRDLHKGLAKATQGCQRGEYSKGRHSFDLLARIDPATVRQASAHCDRLLRALDEVCSR